MAQPRYFALKLPIAVDAQAATFVYVDPGQSTDSELRAWGAAHAPLWAALRARTFAVHVVAVGMGAETAARAATVLTHWTQAGDEQDADEPAGPTKADPDIRQELARIEGAFTTGDPATISALGGLNKATRRLIEIRAMPEGTPTRPTARVAIDRYATWNTTRLISPEAATPDTAQPSVPCRGRTRGRGLGRATCNTDTGGVLQKHRGWCYITTSMFRCRCSGFSS